MSKAERTWRFFGRAYIKIMFSFLWEGTQTSITNPRDAAQTALVPSDRQTQVCEVIGDPFILRIDNSSIYRAFFPLPLPLRRPGLLRKVCLGYSQRRGGWQTGSHRSLTWPGTRLHYYTVSRALRSSAGHRRPQVFVSLLSCRPFGTHADINGTRERNSQENTADAGANVQYRGTRPGALQIAGTQ